MKLGSADWEDHRAFLAVLSAGSLSAAARALNVTQPTIRRRLEALERSVGVALFTRSQTGLTPTEAARTLGKHAEAMQAAAEAFARAASGEAAAPRGTVRITASDVMGAEVLPSMLAELQRLHPRLVLELSLSNRSEDLLRQEADIAVRMVRPAQAALVARHVGDIRLGLFAHRDYLAAHGVPRKLDELNRFAVIGPDRETVDLLALNRHGFGVRREMLTLRTDSQLAQLGAIRAGLGIGLCHAALAARSPELVPVLAADFVYDYPTWIVMHEDLRQVVRVRTCFDHLVTAVGAYTAQSRTV
jgi:DNA-binding transcriptional LysR family regulator